MATSSSRGPAIPFLGNIVDRVPGGARTVRRTIALLAVGLGLLVVFGAFRGKRYAAWAPLDVVESTDPLQEIPIRVANESGAVAPAEAHDALLDLTNIESLVVGVDLDYVPRGAQAYVAVLSDEGGTERFRDAIAPEYFEDGRFMLRLFAGPLEAGDYLLEVEATETDGTTRVVGASWFQIVK